MTTSAPLCTDILDSGVRAGPDFPHCINPETCRANARCFWRGFHQLADDQYRKRQESAQKDLFG
jgi:hypothetical protein